ncbi:hypothetical protein ACFRFU_36680 [Streptomyces sp. NPDC056704]|uniref:hypothetical protein n=1 Tax=Streptomyces sp. NPDC056704 TaxID=3345917 RepID=UPI0036AB3B1F
MYGYTGVHDSPTSFWFPEANGWLASQGYERLGDRLLVPGRSGVCGAATAPPPAGGGLVHGARHGAYYLLSTVDGPLVVIPIAAVYALAAQGRILASVAMAAVMVIGVGALVGTGDVTGTAVFMLTGWLVAMAALGAMRHSRLTYSKSRPDCAPRSDCALPANCTTSSATPCR